MKSNRPKIPPLCVETPLMASFKEGVRASSLITITLCIILTGCATSRPQAHSPFTQPQFGMTKKQLVDMFGLPDAIEIYQKPDKTRIEFDTYTREYESSEVKVPVCLINNRVAGWGKTYYEDHVSNDDTRIK